MKLNAAQLTKHLTGTLAPVYAISGDEPLLCQEACDAVRAACRQQGFTERQVFHVDAAFDWNYLREEAASLSLFADRKLIELRMPTGKPSDAGVSALLDYLSRPPEDTVLLISLPKLDGKAQKSKWAKPLLEEKHCQFVQIWPLETAQLPEWLRQRLAKEGLSATPDAVNLLAARVEGNLLAAVQEISRLRLLVEGNNVDADTVQASVADSARFDLFGLLDILLAGDATQSLRMLSGLRAEGIEPPVILWGMAREIRQLAGLAWQYEQGTPLERALSQVKPPIFGKRQTLVARAVPRLSAQRWNALLRVALRIDDQITGQAPGDPWFGLTQLALQIAGRPLPLPPL